MSNKNRPPVSGGLLLKLVGLFLLNLVDQARWDIDHLLA